MIGQNGKIHIVLCLVLLVITNSLFSKQLQFENSKYIADWSFKDDFKGDINDSPISELKFNQTYNLFLQVQDHINEDLLFTISNGDINLCFDFKTLIQMSKYSKIICPKIAFYEISNGINILYCSTLIGSNCQACIITFDFHQKQIFISKSKRVSDLFFYTFSYDNSSLLNQIYSRIFFNTSLSIPKELNFYSRGERLCGFGSRAIYTTLLNNNIYQDFSRNENKDFFSYLDMENSEKIIKPEYFIHYYDKIAITDFSIITKTALKENDLIYSSANMTEFSDKPWCPSINISEEEISIKTNQNIGGIYFCNGFFRASREDLYFKNNRVKEIEFVYPESYGLKHRVILIDTFKPQFIPLLNIECREIKIKVLSVYKGTDYNDTCINAIYPVSLLSESDYYRSQK